MTQTEIERLCALWQKRLRLQDWDVEVKIKRYHELDPQGRCTATSELKYAEIELRDPNDCPDPKSVAYQDIEAILVHELLHIPFFASNREPTEAERTGLEQAIVQTAKCLIALARGSS